MQIKISGSDIKQNMNIKDTPEKTEISDNKTNIGASDNKTSTEPASTENPKKESRKYSAISKDGDTLELSDKGKISGKNINTQNLSVSLNNTSMASGKKISAAMLSGYPEGKLKLLYANKEITKQQYDSVMKKKKGK